MHNIVISSIGHAVPEHKIPNAFFTQLDIESEAQWIEERTGILSRYSVLDPETIMQLRHGNLDPLLLHREKRYASIADLAELCWAEAQKKHQYSMLQGFTPQLLLLGTSIPDFEIPANATSIAAKLKLSCCSFDVNSACSSFIVDLSVAKAMLENDSYNSAAIFNVERYTTRLDFTDRRSAILFGDGATAAFIEKHERTRGLKVIDILVKSDPSGYDMITIPNLGFFTQNGAAVQRFAIQKTIEATLEILERNALTPANIHYFVGHQANLRMLQSVAQKLGLRDEQHLFNVDHYGNQGAAGAPSVLAQNWDRFNPGDKIVVAVVGSGLTYGAALLEWRQ